MEKIKVICIDQHEDSLRKLLHDMLLFNEIVDIYDFDNTEDAYIFMEHLQEVENKNSIGIVITDTLSLNKHSKGLNFLRELYWDIRYYGTYKILTTGLPLNKSLKDEMFNNGINGYLQKPWHKKEFCYQIHHGLKHHLIENKNISSTRLNMLEKIYTATLEKKTL